MTFLALSTALFGVLASSLLFMAQKFFNYQNKKYLWIIIFIVGALLRSSFLFHPVDTESWRESDISLIAKNYYENGMNFFHPQVNWGSGPGYVESEFPLYPYLIALSYKVFGMYEPTGRLISLLFSVMSLLVFFKLSQKLLSKNVAILASLLFSISPLPNIIGTAIQSESMMFFFYLCSAYFFIDWIESSGRRSYIPAIICTALALLLKITAIHIGFLFLFIILIKKEAKFLINTKVLIFGILSLLPAIAWYFYSHQFYLKYGNSLGISNEYSFMGLDFFTDPYFITGILKLEIQYIWFYSGLFIIGLALLFTNIRKHSAFVYSCCWFLSICIFYVITSRTTADSWAYYYHVFSSVPASFILGLSFFKLQEKLFELIKKRELINHKLIPNLINLTLVAFLIVHLGLTYKSLINHKDEKFATSNYYNSVKEISKVIPAGSTVLASGDVCKDRKGYEVAYNSSYFFYWLNCRGSNLCIDDQSIQNVFKYKKNGFNYFIGETRALSKKAGFTEILKSTFQVVYEDKGLIIFKL
jgi:hypothetical protein